MPPPAAPDLSNIIPPKHLTNDDRANVFQHLFCRLASYRNTIELYAQTESALASSEESGAQRRDQFNKEIDIWAQDLLARAWAVCVESNKGILAIDYNEDI
jgi:hypothetical protein